MAYGKSFATSEDIYPLKVVDYFERVSKIPDGEQKLQAVIDGETFCWPFLEGSEYEISKKKLYALIASKADSVKPYGPLSKANALIKLQQREARAARIYGETGLVVVPAKRSTEETKKILDSLADEDNDPTK